MLSNILPILFYGTLLLFIFIKMYNYILIKKHNCKDLYKEKREQIKQCKFSKVIKILLIVSLIGLIIYIPFGITNFYFSLAFMIFDMGEKLNNSISLLSVILYIVYFLFITYQLYINMLLNKFLRNYKEL